MGGSGGSGDDGDKSNGGSGLGGGSSSSDAYSSLPWWEFNIFCDKEYVF